MAFSFSALAAATGAITSSPEFTLERPSAKAQRLLISPEASIAIIDTSMFPPTGDRRRKTLIAQRGERTNSYVFGTSFSSPVSKFFSVVMPWSSTTLLSPLSPRSHEKRSSPVERMRTWFAAAMRGIL